MKTILLAGAALAALTFGAEAQSRYNPITAPPATQMVSGDGLIFGGFLHSRYDYDDNKGGTQSGTTLGGLARVNVWVAPSMTVQFDLFGESTNFNYGYGPSVVDVVGHVSWRNPTHLVGLFGSLGSSSGYRVGSAGVEGQLLMAQWLLYAQAGYSTFLTDSKYNPSSFYVHAEGRYYFNPNLLVEANLGFATLDSDGDTDSTAIRWGLDLEHRFTNSPFGLAAIYQGSRISGDGATLTSHAFKLGVKWYFNDTTLQGRDTNGSTLKDFNPLNGVNWLGSYFGAT